jgi:hypothetical protein
MTPELLAAFTSWGLPGAIVAFALWSASRREDAAATERRALLADLRDEQRARIEDARENLRLVLEVERQTQETVEKIEKLVDIISGKAAP